MKFNIKLSIILITLMLVLVGCTNADGGSNNNNGNNEPTAQTVEITDAHGTWSVPINPETVVSLDNRTFETLEAWGIKLAAAPKGVMIADSGYVLDEEVLDIGNHREPNLEVIAAVEPQLVIVGQRFASYYDQIVEIVPEAVVLDLNIDVSENTNAQGENLVNGFKETTLSLGKIFDKNDEAAELIAEFDKAIEDAKTAYNETDTVMSVVVSGGEIGFSAPNSGRVWGPIYQILGWTSSLEVEDASSDHQGDDISVEAIAQSNPDWLMVLDRDASVSTVDGAVPAADVIENAQALQNVTAVKEGQVVYAPNDTYTNESIQTFIEIFNSLAEAFNK